MPEAAAVEEAVPAAVVAGVIDLGELQAPDLLKALRVEIFVCAPDLGEKENYRVISPGNVQGWLGRAGELVGPTNHSTTKGGESSEVQELQHKCIYGLVHTLPSAPFTAFAWV